MVTRMGTWARVGAMSLSIPSRATLRPARKDAKRKFREPYVHLEGARAQAPRTRVDMVIP